MGYKGEIIEFTTKDGLLLNGFLQRPRNAKVCLIHVHGMNSNFYGRRTLTVNQELNKKGIASLSINTRGAGMISRMIRKSGKKLNAGTGFERFEDCLYDIRGAINFANRLGFKRIVLSGQSTGCQKIVYYQYKKRDRRVIGLVLIAPADDYNSNKKDLGKKFNPTVRIYERMVKNGRGDEIMNTPSGLFSAKRFLSIAEPERNEARVFNYDGELKEFAAIKIPMCVVFGSREQFATEPVKEYMRILKKKSRSGFLEEEIMRGADHFFRKREKDLAEIVSNFVLKISKKR